MVADSQRRQSRMFVAREIGPGRSSPPVPAAAFAVRPSAARSRSAPLTDAGAARHSWPVTEADALEPLLGEPTPFDAIDPATAAAPP